MDKFQVVSCQCQVKRHLFVLENCIVIDLPIIIFVLQFRNLLLHIPIYIKVKLQLFYTIFVEYFVSQAVT